MRNSRSALEFYACALFQAPALLFYSLDFEIDKNFFWGASIASPFYIWFLFFFTRHLNNSTIFAIFFFFVICFNYEVLSFSSIFFISSFCPILSVFFNFDSLQPCRPFFNFVSIFWSAINWKSQSCFVMYIAYEAAVLQALTRSSSTTWSTRFSKSARVWLVSQSWTVVLIQDYIKFLPLTGSSLVCPLKKYVKRTFLDHCS